MQKHPGSPSSQFGQHESGGGSSPSQLHGNLSPRQQGYSPRQSNFSPRHQGSPRRQQPFSYSPRHQSQPWNQNNTSYDFTPLPPSRANSSYNNQTNSENHRHSNHHHKPYSHNNRGPYQGNRRNISEQSIEAYFSPCMLADPWNKLEEKMKNKELGVLIQPPTSPSVL